MTGADEVVKLLIDAGADVRVQGQANRRCRCMQQQNTVMKELFRHYLRREPKVNSRGSGRASALQFAAYGGHETIARLLIRHGVDVNAKDGFRDTALHAAAGGGYTDIVRLLLEHGADFGSSGF